jgi:hypothetical protein
MLVFSLNMEKNPLENRARILEFMKANGPVIPAQIAKEVNTNILFASAMLSELLASKQIKISSVKVGGTPLYYMEGQEHKLQNYADRLNQREREAYELLKSKGVLRDKEQSPVVRVALRAIKDFAKPLNVKAGETVEIFWKWYMLSNADAETKIKPLLQRKEEKTEPVKEEIKEAPKKIEIVKEQVPAPKEEPKEIRKEEPEEEFISKKPMAEKLPEVKSSTGFLGEVLAYFKDNKIEILEQNIIKASSEIDFIVRIPSPVGTLNYYVKSKKKKKCNDGDLAAAYVKGESKKLPILFITTGDLTKKAKEMLGHEFKNIAYRKL